MNQCDKDEFMECAERFINTPYIWGGDDPTGIDCSGLVVECLKTVGLLGKYNDLTADGIWRKYKDKEPDCSKDRTIERLTRPGATIPAKEVGGVLVADAIIDRGDLIFWFNENGKATHVAIAKNDQYCITADGGGSKVTTVEKAWKANAYVKVRRIDHRGENFRVVALWD